MKKVLLIDCDAVAWSAYHSLPDALSHNEQDTAVIYGFLNSVFYQQTVEDADLIGFIWDSRKSKRIKIFPEYKLKRRTVKEEYTDDEKRSHSSRSQQFKLLRKKILPELGFSNVFMQKGYEGDDIIAALALKYRKRNFVRILARDGDLFQLLDGNCTMFDWVKQEILDDEWFFKRYGIYPDMWADVKAIAGCPTDEVPGVKGIGYERAIKYLLGNMKHTSVLYKRIVNSPELIDLTRTLTTLPLEGTKQYRLKYDTCTVSKLKAVAKEYGLNSYVSDGRIMDFRRYFCGRGKAEKKIGTKR